MSHGTAGGGMGGHGGLGHGAGLGHGSGLGHGNHGQGHPQHHSSQYTNAANTGAAYAGVEGTRTRRTLSDRLKSLFRKRTA
jgi:hypothetical protein